LPVSTSSSNRGRGVAAACSCYLIWGLIPLYWRTLETIDPVELIAHRLVWSCVLIVPLLAWREGFAEARISLGTPRGFGMHLLSGTVLAANWLIFIWAVNNGHVIETSLGYFLVPLVNVALGRIFLHERLRRPQQIAIALAASGVVWQLIQLDRLPWIALALAATFGSYGLLRKKSPLGALAGLTVESALLAPFATAYLGWRWHAGGGALGHAPTGLQWLVLSTGAVTAVPLILFAYGARELRLTTMGLMQYIAPTVQFALGLLVYHERFQAGQAGSFALIWMGLACYTADALWRQRGRAS